MQKELYVNIRYASLPCQYIVGFFVVVVVFVVTKEADRCNSTGESTPTWTDLGGEQEG